MVHNQSGLKVSVKTWHNEILGRTDWGVEKIITEKKKKKKKWGPAKKNQGVGKPLEVRRHRKASILGNGAKKVGGLWGSTDNAV